MAAATHCAYSLQLPQVDRLLQEIHPLIWGDRWATHQIAHARGIPLVAGGHNDVQVLEGSTHLHAGAPTPRLRTVICL
jgi:hypothetical protein